MGASALEFPPPPRMYPAATQAALVRPIALVGALQLFQVQADIAPALLDPICPAGLSCTAALLLAGGDLVVQQDAATATVSRGDWTLFRPDHAVRIDQAGMARVVLMPADLFYEYGLSLRGAAMNVFSGGRPINRIVYSLFDSIFADAAALGAGDGQDLAFAAVRVLKNALMDRAPPRGVKATMLARVREVIEWRIRDPALSTEQIAKALRCTPRHVHRAFEGEGETVGQYILRRRLERCREDLVSPELAGRSVTEIAFSWGFNNAAHFSRVYKKQFGCQPSACRGCRRPADTSRSLPRLTGSNA